MASLSLKISIVEKDVVKTMQFDPNTAVYDACRVIRDKITEANLGQRKSTLSSHSPSLIHFFPSLFFIYSQRLRTFPCRWRSKKGHLAWAGPQFRILCPPHWGIIRNLPEYPISIELIRCPFQSIGFAGIPQKDEDAESADAGRHSQDNAGRRQSARHQFDGSHLHENWYV